MSLCSARVGFEEGLHTTIVWALLRFGSGTGPGRMGEAMGRSLCARTRRPGTRVTSAARARARIRVMANLQFSFAGPATALGWQAERPYRKSLSGVTR